MAVKKLANGQEIDKSVNAINYTEFVVKKKVDVKTTILKIVVAIACIAGVGYLFFGTGSMAIFFGSFGGLITGVMIFVIYPMTDTTYYYETESGVFTIMTRHGVLKGKPFEVRFSAMEKMAPINSEHADEYNGFKDYTVYDFTSHKYGGDDYFGVWEEDGKKYCVKYQCTNNLLKIMTHYNKKGTVQVDTLTR